MRGRWLMGIALMLTACAAPTPEPDRVATRVVEELAVSATLTAVARDAQPAATSTPSSTNTVVPTTAPLPTDTPLPIATDTLPSPTETQRPSTSTPPQDDPTVPGFGNPNSLTGRITLPGYVGPLADPIFTDQKIGRAHV